MLESGLQAKRMGNFDLALEFYEKAREISPTDKRIFGNIFRIYPATARILSCGAIDINPLRLARI